MGVSLVREFLVQVFNAVRGFSRYRRLWNGSFQQNSKIRLISRLAIFFSRDGCLWNENFYYTSIIRLISMPKKTVFLNLCVYGTRISSIVQQRFLSRLAVFRYWCQWNGISHQELVQKKNKIKISHSFHPAVFQTVKMLILLK